MFQLLCFFPDPQVKTLTEEDAERIKACPINKSLPNFLVTTASCNCQAMTSVDEMSPAERKRQREALRRRLSQPGPKVDF